MASDVRPTTAGTKPQSEPLEPLEKFAAEQFAPQHATVLYLLETMESRFMALAALTERIGVPLHMALPKVLEDRSKGLRLPLDDQMRLGNQLPTLFHHPVIQNALTNGNPLDIGSIMIAAGFASYNYELSPMLNAMLRGGHFFMETIRQGVPYAIEKKQQVGVEIEFTPQPGMTRDDAYLALKNRLEAAGHRVSLLEWKDIKDSAGKEGSRDFMYGTKPGLFPIVLGEFTYEGKTLRTQLLQGTSAFMHTVTWGPDNSVRDRAEAETWEEAARELEQRVAKELNIGSAASVRDLMGKPEHYQESRIYMLKDNDGDIAMVGVKLLPNDKAQLTGNNCRIYDKEGVPQEHIIIDVPGNTDAERFEAVRDYLKDTVHGTEDKPHHFAKKVDRFGGMRVDGINDLFRIVVEAHPDLEIVTPRLTADQSEVVSLLIEGLHEGGFEGTRAVNVVGIHVHGGLPLTYRYPNGNFKFTIAPAVNMMRAYIQDAVDFTNAVPTNRNRKGFIHDMRPELIDLFNEVDYVTDPTDPHQILRVCADLVRLTRTKYTALNLDNFVSQLLGAMLLGYEEKDAEGKVIAKLKPALEIGEEADKIYHVDYVSPRHGKIHYTLQTVKTSEGINVRLLTPELLPEPKERPVGKDGQPLPYLDLIRIKPTAWKRTAEFRHYDTILFDSRIAALDMLFTAAYTATYGKRYLLKPEQLAELRARVAAPVPLLQGPQPLPPSGERGLVTPDVMSFGALAALERAYDMRERLHTMAHSFAKGGAVFLLGDMASEIMLGHWEYLKTLALPQIAKDYALLTAGGEPLRALLAASYDTQLMSSVSPFFKSLLGRTVPLFGALTAQHWGNTGKLDVEHLPQAAASVMAASALVQGGLTMAGQSSHLRRLAQVFKLAKVASGPTFLGLVATSAAEFVIIKSMNRIMEEMAEASNLAKITNNIGEFLSLAHHTVVALSQGQPVSPATLQVIQDRLDRDIEALEKAQTLSERRVWAQFAQNEADLSSWYRAEMGRTLDGTFTYGEIEARYQARKAELIATRTTDLAALKVDTTHATHLPVDPAEDWTAFLNAVDEDQEKADVDMDGNPCGRDLTQWRYQSMLDPNTHIMAAQLTQFRADFVAAVQRYQAPSLHLPLQMAQR